MTSGTRCIVNAMTPTNILAAICAIETIYAGRLHTLDVTLVAHYPGGSDLLATEFADVARALARPFAYIRRVVGLRQSDYDKLERDPGQLLPAAAALRQVLGAEQADVWLYSHDVSGTLTPALMQAYPTAERICFGDALGQVFQKDFHLGLLGQAAPKDVTDGRRPGIVTKWLALVGRRAALKPGAIVSGSLIPDRAVLILPVDQSGEFLRFSRLTVCPKPLVKDVFGVVSDSCRDLTAYAAGLLSASSGRARFLLLTENWAETTTIDFEREIELYCEILNAHCPPGSVILVKTHPGEELPRIPILMERLRNKYEIVGMDRRFQRYPIELWPALVQACTVISTMYPSLSLKYLYDLDVIQPMDEKFVEKWFAPWTWASYKDSVALNMRPLERLSTWNGRGVLWEGGADSARENLALDRKQAAASLERP